MARHVGKGGKGAKALISMWTRAESVGLGLWAAGGNRRMLRRRRQGGSCDGSTVHSGWGGVGGSARGVFAPSQHRCSGHRRRRRDSGEGKNISGWKLGRAHSVLRALISTLSYGNASQAFGVSGRSESGPNMTKGEVGTECNPRLAQYRCAGRALREKPNAGNRAGLGG